MQLANSAGSIIAPCRRRALCGGIRDLLRRKWVSIKGEMGLWENGCRQYLPGHSLQKYMKPCAHNHDAQ